MNKIILKQTNKKPQTNKQKKPLEGSYLTHSNMTEVKKEVRFGKETQTDVGMGGKEEGRSEIRKCFQEEERKE